ncbi:biotin--[acetyl-CoA-carboxylase] ligase [Acidisoma sp. C75]
MRGEEGTPPLHLPAGYRLLEEGIIASTSDACIARARMGEADGLAILAEGQTAARGSRGRGWTGAPGNLYFSVLLRPRNAVEAEASGAGRWALLAGIAFIEALRAFAAEPAALSLKWPNDVLGEGAKLGGILVDAAFTGEPPGRLDWLVIGFGANLAAAPAVPGRATAMLAAAGGRPPGPPAVAARLLSRIDHWRQVLAAEGFAPLRAAWLAAGHPLGTPLRIRDAQGEREGLFGGLSAGGALLLQAPGGEMVALSTGEVLLGQGGQAPCYS